MFSFLVSYFFLLHILNLLFIIIFLLLSSSCILYFCSVFVGIYSTNVCHLCNHGSEICNTNIMGDRFKKSNHDFLLNPFCINSVYP